MVVLENKCNYKILKKMSTIKSIKIYINNPRSFFKNVLRKYFQWISDELFLRILFRLQMKERLHLKHPVTFNEKLQWIKLYDRRAEYVMMVDKYAVKGYVSNIIGKEYVIPTLGVWNKPEDIEWDLLPNRFVLKTTHGGGNAGVVICTDKSTINKAHTIALLNKGLQQDIYRSSREWPYKNVQRRIIAEEFIQPSKGQDELMDYKFFCFDGKVKVMYIATNRQKKNGEDVKFDFFDENFNHLPFRQCHDNATVMPQKPKSFDEMKRLAAALSKGIPQVRIDFYEVDGHPIFGEMTLFHASGLYAFTPRKYDEIMGAMILLP